MSQSITGLHTESTNLQASESKPCKQQSQIMCTESLVIETSKKPIGLLDIKKVKPQTPTSNCGHEATT